MIVMLDLSPDEKVSVYPPNHGGGLISSTMAQEPMV